jgi:thioredoxin-like negative regulator of GroEL
MSRAILTVTALAALGALAVAWWWIGREDRRLAESVRASVRDRRLEGVDPLIERWIALRPSDGEPHYWKARVLLARDQAQPTLDALRASLERGFNRELLDAMRGVLLSRASRFQEAEPLLRAAMARKLGPEPEIAEGLARVYLRTFQLAKAARALDAWREAAPDDARPHLWQNAIEERNTADDSVIIRNYRLALERDPNLDEARLKLADKLREGQRNEEAEAEYERHLKRNPKSVAAMVGAARTALQKGDLPGATTRFNEALALDPREPTALLELALIDLRQGAFARARDRLKTVVEIDAFNPEVRASYARALKMAGDEARSAEQSSIVERLRREHRRIAEIREALVGRPNDVELRSEAALWLLSHGHEAEALEWAQLILRDRPGHRPICEALADHYDRKGNAGLANY